MSNQISYGLVISTGIIWTIATAPSARIVGIAEVVLGFVSCVTLFHVTLILARKLCPNHLAIVDDFKQELNRP